MAMQWWKCYTNIFDNDKMLVIETTQKSNADTIILIWVRLLNLSAQLNNKGIFKFGDKAYPFETICKMLHKSGKKGLEQVKLALETLSSLEMINYYDGIIEIKNWHEYQSQDKYDELLEKNRERQQKFREKKKQESTITPEIQEIIKGIRVNK